jgi:lipopolysaccharide biosynthesis glycosyltransferase
MTEPLQIFVGYDEREAEAFDVCRASLLRHASVPLHIVKLDQAALRRAGWYRREWRHVEGQKVDLGDLKPFSTDFAFTRFLVPALSLYQGWALFCDGDFLFTDDIAKLFALADDRYAVMCVKHDHDPAETIKMGGIVQSRYRRKNWSSFCLYNNANPSNASLTGYVVNNFAGQWLHAFNWLKDDEIGSLPLEWNWLSGVLPKLPPEVRMPAGIHFTLGIPTMPGCADAPYADLWRAERAR